MNYNPSPKAEFIQDADLIKHHHELLNNEWLKVSLGIALQEMQRRAAQSTEPANFNACAASHLRMLGAQDFVDIFLNLAETQAPVTRTDTTNLPQNLPTRKN